MKIIMKCNILIKFCALKGRLLNMKFTKGLVVGGLLATGLLMMYNDTDLLNKNKMMKKGKKFVKKMGII